MAELLRVEGLVKRFGALTATDGAELSVREGEVHALIGPNGAGKTTLIQLISGALAPDAGRVLFERRDVSALSMDARARAGLVRSYQITSIFKRYSVMDNLLLAVLARRDGGRNIWRIAQRDYVAHAEAEAIAQRVGLTGQLERSAGSLGHGEQRLLELGLALASKPRLLLLDEPMAGLGPDESARMFALLQHFRQHLTLVLVEHDMDAVFRLADKVSTLVAGRIIASGVPTEVRQDPEVRQAYLGDELDDEGYAGALTDPTLPMGA